MRALLDVPRVPGQSGEVVFRLLILFTTIPLLELALLLWIGARIGVVPTVALILFTGVLGAGLARFQGLATWARFQRALAAGRLPTQEILEGLLILVAGAVLLTPGVLTDAAGFSLLVPPTRRWVVQRIEGHLRRRIEVHGVSTTRREDAEESEPGVVDVDFQVVDDDGEPGR